MKRHDWKVLPVVGYNERVFSLNLQEALNNMEAEGYEPLFENILEVGCRDDMFAVFLIGRRDAQHVAEEPVEASAEPPRLGATFVLKKTG